MVQTGGGGHHDYYKILNVSPNASNEEIQKAYKSLSKTFHPDRLVSRLRAAQRSRTFLEARPEIGTQDVELAREIFVRIKTAHDILNDTVYRFVYDQYGNAGVQYLQLCERARESKQTKQDTRGQLPIDAALYSKLRYLLHVDDKDHHQQQQHDNRRERDREIRLAVDILRRSIERFRQQVELQKQRIRDSILFDVDATVEFPCSHHHMLRDDSSVVPYLELEGANIEFTIKTTNQNLPKQSSVLDENNSAEDEEDTGASAQQQNQQQQQQRHICSGSFGASTQWAANGTSAMEITIGTEYQERQSSNTKWGCEATTPITWVKQLEQQQQQQQRQLPPVTLQFSSTHVFVNGSTAVANLRGNILSHKMWQCSFTSIRKLSIRRLLGLPQQQQQHYVVPNPTMIMGDVRGVCGGTLNIFALEPANFYISLTTIPTPASAAAKQSHHHQQQEEEDDDDNNSKWKFSEPELSVRVGYLPIPFHATMEYAEFGKPWLSFMTSWSWNSNINSSKIKCMVSAELWGSYEDNDTTTIRTGLRHDYLSGWIWLWEWSEMDWTLKVPISLSDSKNAAWILIAMGWNDIKPAENLHQFVFNFLAIYFVQKVGGSMLSEWTTTTNDGKSNSHQSSRRRKVGDATISDDHRDSSSDFQLDGYPSNNQIGGGGRRHQRLEIFWSLMEKVSKRKREEELAKDGLVIKSAKIVVKKRTHHHHQNNYDIRDALQFWVREGRLTLPPLSSQKAPYYYVVGGLDDEDNDPSSKSVLSRNWSEHFQQKWQNVLDWIQNILVLAGGRNDNNNKGALMADDEQSVGLRIRYQNGGNVYETFLHGGDQIVLPDPYALLLGPAESVQ